MRAIASHNGLEAARRAYELLRQGADELDACIAGVEIIEDDPAETSVGYGGIPNEQGFVELDAAVMHGPTHRVGGVAALRGIRHPSRLAKLVMEQTDHGLLVGDGALQFARAQGFVEENLLTEHARKVWLHWKRTLSDRDKWLAPDPATVDPAVLEWFHKHERPGGTVHCAGQGAGGNISCVTSTSGLAFKLPGRVGDSPVIGAGLYVDNEVGSCGSIGRGEENLRNCTSFACVELMRQGKSPREAALEVARRIVAHAPSRLRDEQGRPRFNLWLYVLSRGGDYCGASLWGPRDFAVADERGARLEPCVWLYDLPT